MVKGMPSPRVGGHISQLDGVRGVAVLLVMLLHTVYLDGSLLPDRALAFVVRGGWVGVDLFFVLSGFLITGILLDAKGREGYFTTFYARRTLRIFPLYYAYLVGLTIYAYVVAPGLPASISWRDTQWWWHVAYLQNYMEVFGSAGPHLQINQLWSLAVEEQFYLVWPLVVWRCSQKTLLKIVIGGILFALALRVGLTIHGVNPSTIYGLTPTRMDTLLMGAAVALLIRQPFDQVLQTALIRYGAWAGLCLVGVAVASDHSLKSGGLGMQTAGYTGTALLSAALVFHCATSGGRIAQLMNAGILRWFGRYSYALYLLHLVATVVVFDYVPIERLPQPFGLIFPAAVLRATLAIGFAAALALLSWNLLERHMLRLKKYFEPRGRSRAVAPADIVVEQPSIQ